MHPDRHRRARRQRGAGRDRNGAQDARRVVRRETGLRTPRLYPTARLLAQITGHAIPRNKSVVGDNAFAHESGIHQHGMLKHRGTYEIMRPEDVGFARSQLVLGKHSGRHALRERLAALGHAPDEAELDQIFTRFKTLADKKREVFDSDLEALALGRDAEALGPWRIVHLHAASHLGGSASASVRLQHEDGSQSARPRLAMVRWTRPCARSAVPYVRTSN